MIVERQVVRAILINPEEEVLLMRIRPREGVLVWITPGGGLEPEETCGAGLRRELGEELGLDDFAIGPVLWRRQHTFQSAEKRICQYEQYYAVHVQRFVPRISDAVEAVSLDRFRWWPLTELKCTDELLSPISLARIVADYLVQGPPGEPLRVEILDDQGRGRFAPPPPPVKRRLLERP